MRVVLNCVFIFFLFFSPIHSFSQTKASIQVYDSSRVCEGYILWQNLVLNDLLIDRHGKILYNFPGCHSTFFQNKKEIVSSASENLISYNKDFDESWKVKMKTFISHEITITPQNNILLISYENQEINNINYRFDNIICFDSTGKELYTWSTFDQHRYLIRFMMTDTNIFLYRIRGVTDPDSIFFHIVPGFKIIGGYFPEFFHMNAIQVIPKNESEKKDSVFREGNLLLSFCNYNDSLASFIAIVDPVNYKILWHYVQKDRRPMHTPVMLPNGHILVYINSASEVGSSFIDEIDPIKNKIVWNYTEKFPDVITRAGGGSCQRLPNGNTLISNASGYIYEITPHKKIVWQYFTGEKQNAVYRAYWYPKEKLKWLVNEE